MRIYIYIWLRRAKTAERIEDRGVGWGLSCRAKVSAVHGIKIFGTVVMLKVKVNVLHMAPLMRTS